MGRIKRYECECGYKKDLSVGTGLSSANLSIIKKCVPRSVFNKFEAELYKGKITEYISGNQAILCESCREIETVSSFTYTFSNGRKTRYVAPCPKCGKVGLEIEDTDHILCPECGKIMMCYDIGLWD